MQEGVKLSQEKQYSFLSSFGQLFFAVPPQALTRQLPLALPGRRGAFAPPKASPLWAKPKGGVCLAIASQALAGPEGVP